MGAISRLIAYQCLSMNGLYRVNSKRFGKLIAMKWLVTLGLAIAACAFWLSGKDGERMKNEFIYARDSKAGLANDGW
jgi:hypothetical protein